GPRASYARHGFGLLAVTLRDSGETIGICGLLKGDALEHPDGGCACRPRHWSKGCAFESAFAVLRHARAALGLTRILAITSPGNTASIQLLGGLGFVFDRVQRLSADDEVKVFASDGAQP